MHSLKSILHHRLMLPGLLISALLFALAAQYGFGVKPCPLCLYERYVFTGLLAAFTLPFLKILRIPLLLLSLFLCTYHMGIEQHWWKDVLHTCTVSLGNAMDNDAFRAQFTNDVITTCDAVGWRIFGISAVIWTGVFNLILFVIFGIQHASTSSSH